MHFKDLDAVFMFIAHVNGLVCEFGGCFDELKHPYNCEKIAQIIHWFKRTAASS